MYLIKADICSENHQCRCFVFFPSVSGKIRRMIKLILIFSKIDYLVKQTIVFCLYLLYASRQRQYVT